MQVEVLANRAAIKPSIAADPIIVVCAADDNYAMPLAVTLRSAIDNYQGDARLVFYILDGGIQERNKQKIWQSTQSAKCELKFLTVPNLPAIEHLKQINHTLGPDGKTISQYLSVATFFRILIPEVLPAEINKVIYLDCDLVVKGNLAELWQYQLGDNYILAAQDTWIRYVSTANGLLNYRELGISADAKYFNAGVLVINLQKWRADDFCNQSMDYLQHNKQFVRWHDQDILNPLLAGKWGQIDPKWNFNSTSFYDYDTSSYLAWQDERESLFTKDIYHNLIHQPAIVHYASAKKPWTSRHCPRKEDFFKYIDRTAWSGWRLTIWRRLQLKLAGKLKVLVKNFS
ncbi:MULTISPECIES: glycosyltransferase family 8 protein [unclassified Chamaesiphon]|uniref:glycosyltransferase family 8 protein n=1 Tax=unclassified Chamaesiphon TaxID=2620921 RepID=UPI00286A3DDF|nr:MULTISPECIES: glycosyltransferase family 8 protein [unclassified Chamaesiphon]